MPRIGICEDDITQREYMLQEIQSYYNECGEKVKIETFVSAEAFMFHYPEEIPFDCLILDIKMKKIDGMELAKWIRKKDSNIRIIFITGDKDYVFDGYKVSAIRYILKPYKRKDLIEALKCVNESVSEKKAEEVVYISYQGDSLKLVKQDILYVQVKGHYIDICTKGNQYNYKETMQNIRKILNSSEFVMANRSVLINLQHVEKITKTECFMDNEEVLSISRGCYRELNNAFIRYYN